MNKKDKKLRDVILNTERLIEAKRAFVCLCFREDVKGGICCRSTDEDVREVFVSLLEQLGYVPTEPIDGQDFPIFIVPTTKLNGDDWSKFGGAMTMTLRCFLSRHGLTRLSDMDDIEDLFIIDQLAANKNLQNEEDLMERLRILLKI